MGYVAKKKSQKISGTYQYRKRPDGTDYWFLVYENRSKDRPKDTPREQVIAKKDYERIGFDDRLTFEQAKEYCRHLNSKSNLEKKNERQKAKNVAQDNHDELIESVFLPKALVIQFKEKILVKRFADGEKQARFQKLLVHWNYVQKMVADIALDPKDYAEESALFYRYFEKSKISASYVKKVLRILNAWGTFYVRTTTGYGIELVKQPKGLRRQKIVDSNHSKEAKRGPSDALTPEMLNSKNSKSELLEYNYNWLYLSVWLGLRPAEVDGLKENDGKTYRYEVVDLEGFGRTTVLWVYQPKLQSLAVEKRWKPIPLFLPEQQTCVKLIEQREFRRPLNKSLRKAFSEARITCYSGRKGFTDLMISKDQDLEQISVWLGHTSIEMTWKHYKQKQLVRVNKLKKAA